MTTFASDTFVDTDGLILTSHTPTLGGAWAKQSTIAASDLYINGGTNGPACIGDRLNSSGAAYGVDYTTGTPPSADYTVQGDLAFITVLSGDVAYLCGRMAPNGTSDTLYRWDHVAGTGFRLFVAVSASYTQLGSTYTGYTPSNGDVRTMQLVMAGNQISGTISGVTQVGPITDSGVAAANFPGLAIRTVPLVPATDLIGYQWRNWSAFDAASPVLPTRAKTPQYQAIIAQ